MHESTKTNFKSFVSSLPAASGVKETKFLGYESLESDSEILVMWKNQERIDNANRIYGKGFGETTPNVPSPDGCRTLSEEEHQLNRRTEFIIVELGGARTRD